MKKRRDFPAPAPRIFGFRGGGHCCPASPASSGAIRCGAALTGVVRRYSVRFGSVRCGASSASVRVRPVSVGARTQTATAGWCDPSNGCRSASLCRLRERVGRRPAAHRSADPAGHFGAGLAVYRSAPPLACRSPFRLLRRPLLSCNAPISCSWARASCSSSCLRAWASSPLWQPPPDRWRSAAAGFRPAP